MRASSPELNTKAKVVITDYHWPSVDVERAALADLALVVPMQTRTAEEFLTEAADCDALLNAYAGPITAATMANMPRCKIIAKYGIGVDSVDLDAATAAGIIVTNNPDYCVQEVAEHTMALILASARKVVPYDRAVRAGDWSVAVGKPLVRLEGTTLGLIGFGRIGQEVAKRAIAFGMRVLYTQRSGTPAPEQIVATRTDLHTLLGESDFVSLHPPLTVSTRHLINAETLACMKPTAILVNCARGAVIDTDALVWALDTGIIAGCALDTTDPEPLPDPHPLRCRDNVLIHPHVAWYSEQAVAALQSGAPDEVRRLLTGNWPVNVVNVDVKLRNRAGL